MKRYRVLRRLDGDRLYEPGEIREMAPGDAVHLMRSGALEETAEAKAQPPLAAKVEKSLANKAAKPTAKKPRA